MSRLVNNYCLNWMIIEVIFQQTLVTAPYLCRFDSLSYNCRTTSLSSCGPLETSSSWTATNPANITTDEQLLPTEARCKFTQYMGNKPDEFSIKSWLTADVNSQYMVNGSPYLGKEETWNTSQLVWESDAETGGAIPGEKKNHYHRQFLHLPKTGHCLADKEEQPGWHHQ